MARRFDHLADAELFVATVGHGSLTAAAVALATTPAVVSRAISRLESRLGVQLLRRTTRSLGLTEPGRAYFEQARSAFAVIETAERELQGQACEVSGRVRLSVPSTYGHFLLPPLLRSFIERYPRVQVEINITNRNVDLVAEGFDLAVRFGMLPDSGLMARKLLDAPFCLVAAPAYLNKHGAPNTLDELSTHRCIHFIMPRTGRSTAWLLRDGDSLTEWRAERPLEVSDDFVGLATLSAHGLGIAQTFTFIAAERLARGELVEVLPQLRGGSRPVSLIHPPHPQLSPAARAMIEMLAGNT